MTQTQADKEQAWNFAKYGGITALCGLGVLGICYWYMDAFSFEKLINVLLRNMALALWGVSFVLGVYVLADYVFPGSLTDEIRQGNMAASIYAAAVILGAVCCLFIR